jgi:hypothetical protein
MVQLMFSIVFARFINCCQRITSLNKPAAVMDSVFFVLMNSNCSAVSSACSQDHMQPGPYAARTIEYKTVPEGARELRTPSAIHVHQVWHVP